MLPKTQRVDTRTVKKIFKEGKTIASPSLLFKFIRESPGPRISFIAPKNIAKRATTRNTMRRRGYAALRAHLEEFPENLAGVCISKKEDVPLEVLEKDIMAIAAKIK